MELMNSVTTLPFNQHVGIQKSSMKDGLLEIPSGGQFLNHLGTVHAGAQLALAEACSGEYLIQLLANEAGLVPVVRRVEAKFKKPADGRIVASVNSSLTSIEKPILDLATRGRCLLTVHVDIHDESGAHTLTSSIEWFITKVTKSE
jgi:acyl-coenzyme A thioesterase PaaI-like protein